MPSPLLQLRIPQDLADWLEAKYPSRGEVAEYVRQLLTAEQMKEAVAPLVPADYMYDEIPISGGVKESRLDARFIGRSIPTNEEFDAMPKPLVSATTFKPKPKARRKRGVQAVVSERGVLPEDIQIPARCHCGRGMIIAAGPRKGQCTLCGNPKPLKESK